MNDTEKSTEYKLTELWPKISELLSGDVTLTSPDGISALFVLILLVMAGIFATLSLIHYFRAIKQLRFYKSLIKGQSKEALLEKRRDINNSAEKNRKYFYLWREFDESLVVQKRGKEQLCNTLDAAHFFNTHTLARRLTENRLLAAVPGFLTAIGVIGTFAGLQMGLAELDVSSEDFTTLKQGIAGLIGGASIAFLTSVWGVFTSVIFNFFEKFLERNIRSSISNFQNQIDFLYPRITAEQSLTNIEEYTHQSLERLAELDEKIGNKMQEAMQQASDSIRQGMENSLNTILGPAIEKLVENAHNGSEKALESLLERFMDGVGQAGNAQREMMEKAASDINLAASGMSSGLTDFASRLDSQVENMAEKNAKVLADVEAAIRGQLEAQQKREAERQSQLTQQFETFRGSQSELTESIEGVLQTQQSQHQDLTREMTGLLGSFKELSQSHQLATESMQKASSDMNATSNQLGLLSANLKSATDTLTQQLEQAVEQIRDTAVQNSDSISFLKQLVEQMESVNNRMDETAVTLGTAAERADSGLAAVDRHFKALMEDLSKHLEDVNNQVTHLLDEYANKVKDQTADRLNVWNEQTTEFMGAMTDSVRTISAVVDEIDGKVVRSKVGNAS